MIWLTLIPLFVVGLFLSAFFSGSETGFYRVSRVRLALDAMDGDWVSRCLLWLTNNPSLFVATTLIGNNLANYLTSLAIVLGTREFLQGGQHIVEVLAPILLSPVVFVYGELLPKNVFLLAPNLWLRRGGPLFLLCGIVFAPVSAVLWMLGRCLQWVVGEAPEYVRGRLARDELQRMLDEGQEAGVLRPAQRRLAQGMFAVANDPVSRFCTSSPRVPIVHTDATKADVLRRARRHHSPHVLVMAERSRRPAGYVRVVDLHLSDRHWTEEVRPLLTVHHMESHISALIRMQTARETLAQAVDDHGKHVGIISIQRLVEPLLD